MGQMWFLLDECAFSAGAEHQAVPENMVSAEQDRIKHNAEQAASGSSTPAPAAALSALLRGKTDNPQCSPALCGIASVLSQIHLLSAPYPECRS